MEQTKCVNGEPDGKKPTEADSDHKKKRNSQALLNNNKKKPEETLQDF